MRIGNKEIGEGHPTYIIAEIGINHNGDVEAAKELIDAAAEAKVDAVKFQKRHLPSLYTRDILENTLNYEQHFQYMIPILKETELSFLEHGGLKKYAEDRGLEYICTPFDIESAEFLSNLGVKAYKIASCDLTNCNLLARVAIENKPMILSTGMSTWVEISLTVQKLKEARATFTLLHCRSAYPVWPREANLKMITKLKQFGEPVGYSGHDIGTTIPLVVASMGACIIEKHITLDRRGKGPDHKISLLPDELKILVRDIRIADQAMQSTDRYLLRGEVLNRDLFRYKGKHGGEKDIPVIEKEPIGRWGLIARPNDLQEVMKFKPKCVEVRFTEDDFKHGFLQRLYGAELIVHAPEYIGDKLMDLCSGNREIRNRSIEIVQKTIDRAVFMGGYFKGVPKVIVHPGAMSMNKELKVEPLEANLRRSLAKIDPKGIEVLLENLPPYPWYFGGQWKGNYFMCADEIRKFCDGTGYNTCLDVSHAALYCSAKDRSLDAFIRLVKPCIRHVHVADAYGMDGEGVQIGEGDIDFKELKPRLMELLSTHTWVPEVWQGHKNGFKGFVEALNKLKAFRG